ncbi:hypothetical protein KSF_103210 [Reticulibacter mediterranei]|uniref:Uncharacterized protein n=1 Tax=Reticulibacter mediterranei TaxID=2778369 RepID=A0A8J3IXG1_9CHLR|nr:hypothetical protein KSF_103210 [Reticulibacter mediterranei]
MFGSGSRAALVMGELLAFVHAALPSLSIPISSLLFLANKQRFIRIAEEPFSEVISV